MSIDQDKHEHTEARCRLAEKHRRTLEEDSAIARNVIGARGVYTVERGRDLPPVFSARQRRRGPGMLFTVHRPDGSTAWAFRPDAADPDRPGHKYEIPPISRGGPGNVLDVHPYCRDWVGDRTAPVWFVEGIKKADAVVSAARAAGEQVVVVAISGVWNYLSGGEIIPDMFGVPLEGREACICFDSDVFVNPDVADAARRLAAHVQNRGATTVRLAHLPADPDAAKVGADDYLASGRSYADLAGCSKAFDSDDLAVERLRRSDKLRECLDGLWRTFWATCWSGRRGPSARDLYKVLCDIANERGKLHPDGLRARASRREITERFRKSSRTLYGAWEYLEGMGLAYRDNADRRVEERGAFVLRAKVNQAGQGSDTEQKEAKSPLFSYAGGLPSRTPLRTPRQRGSTPARKASRGLVEGTRRVRDSLPAGGRPGVKRLGPRRGALLDTIEASGGAAAITEIGDALHLERPRELVRFRRSSRGRDGLAVMLLEAGIVEWASDVATRREVLRFAENWLERLAEIDDLEADRLRRRIWHEKDRADFRDNRQCQRVVRRGREVKPTPHYVNAGADGYVSDLRPVDAEPPEIEHEGPSEDVQVSPLAAAVRVYLDRNPHDAMRSPYWIGATLWCLDLLDGKPTPEEVRAAVGELGGTAYLEAVLKRTKEAA